MADGYNGYTNYETWAVCLWLDNDQGTQSYWQGVATEIAADARGGGGNKFIDDPKRRAIGLLAELIKEEHNEMAEQWMGDQSSVFADLMNSALGSVNWYEVAESRFDDDEKFTDDEDETESAE